ncbi:MAG: hypothetical protein ACRD3J_14870, partial [Thermoanaerobaculia bacterium]
MKRASYGLVRAFLAQAARKHPRAAFRAAAAFGVLRYRVTRRWPTPDEVRALFPHLDARAVAQTTARISALEERNRVLVRTIAGGGIESVRTVTTASETLARLEGPGILATFHAGGLHAVGAVLGRLRSPVVAFRTGLLFT